MSLRVTFLGTSGAVPTTDRAPSAIFINREGDGLLFDCGEGTQRQMMRFNTGFDISAIFITHLHGDHILGIPGLVQSLSFNGHEKPMTIYTPQGTGDQIKTLLTVGEYEPAFPIEIVELSAGDVARETDEYDVRAFQTHHQTNAIGYALVEVDRPGRFDRQKAEEELDIPPGPAYGRLHAGESVELDDGRVIEPDEVVGEPRPGRKIVYTGDTRPVDATVEIATDADLLVHDATFAADNAGRARKTAHSTGGEAGEIASRADVDRLALTHISSRYGADASPIRREAEDEFGGEVFIATDGQTLEIPFSDERE